MGETTADTGAPPQGLPKAPEVELKLKLGDGAGAPTYLSHAQAIQTDAGVSIIYFYEVALSPLISQEEGAALQKAGASVPTRCTAKVVMSLPRARVLAKMLTDHIAQMDAKK